MSITEKIWENKNLFNNIIFTIEDEKENLNESILV